MMRPTDKIAHITFGDGEDQGEYTGRVWENTLEHKLYVWMGDIYMPVNRFKISPYHTIKLEWSFAERK